MIWRGEFAARIHLPSKVFIRLRTSRLSWRLVFFLLWAGLINNTVCSQRRDAAALWFPVESAFKGHTHTHIWAAGSPSASVFDVEDSPCRASGSCAASFVDLRVFVGFKASSFSGGFPPNEQGCLRGKRKVQGRDICANKTLTVDTQWNLCSFSFLVFFNTRFFTFDKTHC